jgi:polysaccharide export outer membrane protein
LFDSGRTRDAYIDLSGGLTVNADKKRIYIVRANGAVIAGRNSGWFRGGSSAVYAGDTIVVPVDTDRTPKLVQWTGVTQILYQMAIAVAAVNSF